MRKFYRLIFTIVIMVAVAGCGSSNQASDKSSSAEGTTGSKANAELPNAKLISAVKDTANAKSARISVNTKSNGTNAALNSSTVVDGQYDFDKDQGIETIKVTSSAGDSTIEAIVDGSTVYEKLSNAELLSPGKPWTKVDLNSVSKEAGVDVNNLTGGQSSDPSQGLSMLLAAGEDVTKVGSEQVRGENTTHYKGTLDFKKAIAKASDADKTSLQELAQFYGDSTLPIEVWVDSQNRVRKMSYSFDITKIHISTSTTASGSRIIDFTIEFYDFGLPVNVSIPPADQVSELGSLKAPSAG